MKSVTLSLTPTTFVVTGDTKEKCLRMQRKHSLSKYQKSFPHIKYSINDADALTMETSFLGYL
ncbi:hypothetical protein LQK80_35865 [Bacillus thuringiensis]|nr:hypothetical protein [Bacillus thuringiensis]